MHYNEMPFHNDHAACGNHSGAFGKQIAAHQQRSCSVRELSCSIREVAGSCRQSSCSTRESSWSIREAAGSCRQPPWSTRKSLWSVREADRGPPATTMEHSRITGEGAGSSPALEDFGVQHIDRAKSAIMQLHPAWGRAGSTMNHAPGEIGVTRKETS